MANESNTRHLPKGTLDDLREAHLDPSTYGCCHANAADSNGLAIMGCMVEKSCPFAQKRYGGFKGDGPEYVGYYHRTSRADEGKQMENVVSCFTFVSTLLRRMRKGMADKEERRDYEHIEIIALPKHVLARDSSLKSRFGDTVVVTRWSSEAPKSLVNMALVAETVEMEVPKFPRPQDNPGITHNQKLQARLAARESARDSGEEVAETREDRLTRIKAELAEMDAQMPEKPEDDAVDPFTELPTPSGEAPVAEALPSRKKA